MDVYSYRFPDDYPDQLIGVYDPETGSLPHELLIHGFNESWIPPAVSFDVDLSKIDPIPATNLPVALMRNDLERQIQKATTNQVILSPVLVTAGGSPTTDFSILHPTNIVDVWDLEKSSWEGSESRQWPKSVPLVLEKMIVKQGLKMGKTIAYNSQRKTMLVFGKAIGDIITNFGSWVKLFSPQLFNSQH